MTYDQNRTCHDADAQVFENPDFYLPYTDAATRAVPHKTHQDPPYFYLYCQSRQKLDRSAADLEC